MLRILALLPLISLAILPGCAARDAGGSSASSGRKAGSGGSSKYGTNAFGKNKAGDDARTGTWTYSSGKYQGSDCGKLEDYIDDYFGPSKLTRFLATDFRGDQFTFIEKSLNKRVSCTEGRFFDCKAIKGKYDLSEIIKGTAAELDIKIKVTGSFKNASNMDGMFDIDIDCEGRGCGAIAAGARTKFPCGIDMRFQATHPAD